MFAPVSKRAATGIPSTFTVIRGSRDLGVDSILLTAGMSNVGSSFSEVVPTPVGWCESISGRPSRATILGVENFKAALTLGIGPAFGFLSASSVDGIVL